MSARQNIRPITGAELLTAILFIGLVAAIIHGVLWHFTETEFGWNFGGGGGSSMPAGYQAVILSLTLTVPLVILPPIYQLIFGKQILLERHYLASMAIIIGAAIGHLIMYGTNTPRIPGLKESIYPVGTSVTIYRAVSMEFVYAVVYFSSIVLVYQLVANTEYRPMAIIVKYILSLLAWFLAISTYIVVMYPASITDSTWVQVRGVISALCLEIGLIGGMLM